MDVKRWTCSVTNAFPVFWGSMFILDRMYKIKVLTSNPNRALDRFM